MGLLALVLAFGSCTTTNETAGYYPDTPDWAPYYDSYARYYYFPDMFTYYDVSSGDFIYWNGFNWNYASNPPFGYSAYDLSHSYIVVLDRDVYDPWLRHNYYSSVYPKGYYYGPRNMNHPRGVYPYRGYDENANAPIVPGDGPTADPSAPAQVRPNINTGEAPNATRPHSITPDASPSQRPQMERPAPQQQPRIERRAPQQQPRMERPAPQQQPRMQSPAPSQHNAPAPKVGQPRGGR